MILKELKPRKALNKAFLKVKPNRTEMKGSRPISLLYSTGQMTQKAKSFIKTWFPTFSKTLSTNKTIL